MLLTAVLLTIQCTGVRSQASSIRAKKGARETRERDHAAEKSWGSSWSLPGLVGRGLLWILCPSACEPVKCLTLDS